MMVAGAWLRRWLREVDVDESKHTPVAWLHEDGRVIPACTMNAARRDGGAMLSSVSGYTTPLYASAPDLAAEVERLRAESDDDEATRAMMADILSRTAVALRGPEPEGTRWGWSHLPERVAAAIAAIDVMQKAAALNGAEVERLRMENAEMRRKVEALREALRFYAQREHFALSDANAWDTVSGEPQNYWCDDAGTATVEDGATARAALASIAEGA